MLKFIVCVTLTSMIGIALSEGREAASSSISVDAKPIESIVSFKDGTMSPQQRDEWIEKIDHFLSTIRTLSSSFVQVTTHKSGHVMEQRTGVLRWLRPSHIHFVYEGKPALQVLSDGENLRQKDDDGESMSVAIDSTPARLLLQTTVNLRRDALILDVVETPTHITIILANKDDPNGPNLILGFRKNPFCLLQWTTVEDSGRVTDIILNEPKLNISMTKQSFRFKP